MIVDRTVGIHDLSNKTLTQARQILGEALRLLYNIPGITVGITKSRSVAINVTGAVAEPGTYDVYTNRRVSEVLEMAGGITEEGSSRWILFTGGPNAVKVDLDRAVYLGDLDSDPCAYAGQTIHVPNKSENTVNVVGEVRDPREIELVPGDDLATLLALAGGVRRRGDSTAVQIIGGSGSGSRDSFGSGDIISVPPVANHPDDLVVSVFGAVQEPGIYSFKRGMTVGDAVQGAGGLLQDANASFSTVFRRPRLDPEGRFTYDRYPASDLPGTGEAFASFELEPADSVFVPVRVGFVMVMGEVLNPGNYPFSEGRSALYYIQMAGGFLPTANKEEIYVFNPISKITTESSPGVVVRDGSHVKVYIREELK
jgi:protein involved in polysaccharide export with SLBB domain